MSEWRVAPLREIADIRVSNVDKKSTPGEAPVRLCNYMDVYANDYIRADLPFMEATATAAEIQRFGVQQGDVMITKDSETPDDIGIPAVVMDQIENLVCGYHLAQIRPNRGLVDSVYLAKQLALPETAAYFAQRAAGSTRYGLSNRTIADVPIRLAPMGQQRRIAEVLARIDGVIEQIEALIEKHQQIKAGLMHDLFARGALDDGQVRPSARVAPGIYQDSMAGQLPRSWRLAPLGEVCLVIVDCPHSTPSFQADGVLVARTMHIKDGAFLEAFASRVSEREYDQRVERAVPLSGDVVLTREAPVGEAFVIPPGMRLCLGQRVMLIRPNRDCLLPVYLVNQVYGGFVGKQMRDQVAGTTNPHLNVADVRRLLVPLPPIAEQIVIANALSAHATRIGADQALLAKLKLQKLGLMQDLLTGRVAVKVPEPAIPA